MCSTCRMGAGEQHGDWKKVWRKQLEKTRFALDDARTQHSEPPSTNCANAAQTYWMHLQLFEDLWPSAMRANARRRSISSIFSVTSMTWSVLMQTINETPDLLASSDTLALLLEAVIRSQQGITFAGARPCRWPVPENACLKQA